MPSQQLQERTGVVVGMFGNIFGRALELVDMKRVVVRSAGSNTSYWIITQQVANCSSLSKGLRGSLFQAELLRRADAEMKKQGVAVLDWLFALSPGGDQFGTSCTAKQQNIPCLLNYITEGSHDLSFPPPLCD